MKTFMKLLFFPIYFPFWLFGKLFSLFGLLLIDDAMFHFWHRP